ncbi:MAG: ankyrin repeat domain-containing protein [Spirochaetia bacterium]
MKSGIKYCLWGTIIVIVIAGFISCATAGNDPVTPLHEAVRDGEQSRTRELLADGSDPDARDDEGRTPLHQQIPVNSFCD